jgi:hypothetical protein
MMTICNIQIIFFQQLKDRIPPHVSLVDEVSDVLEISLDSAYRRIRGEKQISIEEIQKLCLHFQFPVDPLFINSSQAITFHHTQLKDGSFTFRHYLENILTDLSNLNTDETSSVIFVLNELNLMQILQVPEVAAFKLFFWCKSNLGFESYQNCLFSFEDYGKEMQELSRQIVKEYIKIPTTELITRETLNSILKQILYYHEAGYFEIPGDAIILCDKLLDLINHLQEQAEKESKFIIGIPETAQAGNLKLYFNDLMLSDNIILVTTNKGGMTYLTSIAINLLKSTNQEFYEHNMNWCRNMLSKSVLISGAAERHRKRIFRELKGSITELKSQLETRTMIHE